LPGEIPNANHKGKGTELCAPVAAAAALGRGYIFSAYQGREAMTNREDLIQERLRKVIDGQADGHHQPLSRLSGSPT